MFPTQPQRPGPPAVPAPGASPSGGAPAAPAPGGAPGAPGGGASLPGFDPNNPVQAKMMQAMQGMTAQDSQALATGISPQALAVLKKMLPDANFVWDALARKQGGGAAPAPGQGGAPQPGGGGSPMPSGDGPQPGGPANGPQPGGPSRLSSL